MKEAIEHGYEEILEDARYAAMDSRFSAMKQHLKEAIDYADYNRIRKNKQRLLDIVNIAREEGMMDDISNIIAELRLWR